MDSDGRLIYSFQITKSQYATQYIYMCIIYMIVYIHILLFLLLLFLYLSLWCVAGVIPYLPYSRHCKMRQRGCITAKLIASMMAKAGMHQLITLDLRHRETQGFFDFTVDNLRGSPFLIQYMKEQVCEWLRNGCYYI